MFSLAAAVITEAAKLKAEQDAREKERRATELDRDIAALPSKIAAAKARGSRPSSDKIYEASIADMQTRFDAMRALRKTLRQPEVEATMSRSYRKTPIAGVTGAESDKWFKTVEHRRERRAVRVALRVGLEPPPSKLFGDPWRGDKDGKLWFGDRWPEIARK